MSGIDKIIGQIEQDTKAVCDDMIAKAGAKAKRITDEANAKADAIRSAGEEKITAAVADIRKRGDSAADLEEKKILLYTKQDIISRMLNTAIDLVKNLPDEEYFALILKMVKKYSLPQEGFIRFGKKDLGRLPQNFIDSMNQVSNGKLTLSDEPADIDAGFVLIYGGIDENCSFDAIFAGESETLNDKAGRLLF
jgi:V/A-type H+-transporting ATPase subunit E